MAVINHHDFSTPASATSAAPFPAECRVQDVTSSVISGTVSHAGFGAAYFADDCPYTKFQYLVDSFVVSGTSTNQDNARDVPAERGVRVSALLRVRSTASSNHYIWYYPIDQSWHIGPGGCGHYFCRH